MRLMHVVNSSVTKAAANSTAHTEDEWVQVCDGTADTMNSTKGTTEPIAATVSAVVPAVVPSLIYTPGHIKSNNRTHLIIAIILISLLCCA